MINIEIAPIELKPTEIIANILDTPIFKFILSVSTSFFIAKVIPNTIPRIPTIRLPNERILANIEIGFLKISLINRIENINTPNNDNIQDNVINTRAAISV